MNFDFRGVEWSPESVDDFEALTHAAQWKPLLAKMIKIDIVKEDGGETDQLKQLPHLRLIDTNATEVIMCLRTTLH